MKYVNKKTGLTIETHNEAVAQRAYLEIIANTCHRAALRHDIAEVAHQFKQAILTQGVWILVLDAGNLARNATVHIVGRQFKKMPKRIFQCIFRRPYPGSQFIAVKVL